MGTLSLLPNETILAIIGHILPPDTGPHDYDPSDGCFQASREPRQKKPEQLSLDYTDQLVALRSLCLVSKRLCHLAQPLLYRNFILGYGNPWRSNSLSWAGRLERFTRTVAARPDLAAAVKRVHVHPDLLRAVGTEAQARATIEDVVGAAAAATPEAASALVAAYFNHFEVLQSDPLRAVSLQLAGSELLGLLLALLPNLDSLSMQVSLIQGGIPAGALTTLAGLDTIAPRPGRSGSESGACAPLPLLARLRTLSICSHMAGRSTFSLNLHAHGILEALAATADAGQLTTLNLHMCSRARGLRIAEGGLRHLKRLRITRSRLNAADLGSLLRACAGPGLEEFMYEATYSNTEYSDDSCQPSDAISHLQTQHPTLRSLHLDFRRKGHRTSPDTEGTPRPLSASDGRSMARFAALEHLFLNASAVCNHSTPPPPSPHHADDDDDHRLLTRLLPPNLASLCLAGTLGQVTPRLGAALLHLARTVARRGGEEEAHAYPALRRVRCDAALERSGLGALAVAEAFAAAARERGGGGGLVKFGYGSWPPSGPTLLREEEEKKKETPPRDGGLQARAMWRRLARTPAPMGLAIRDLPMGLATTHLRRQRQAQDLGDGHGDHRGQG